MLTGPEETVSQQLAEDPPARQPRVAESVYARSCQAAVSQTSCREPAYPIIAMFLLAHIEAGVLQSNSNLMLVG